jgi:[acyl-carrier-protein] S-malonyltransferase
MGLSFYQNFTVAKQVIEEINDTLKQRIDNLMFDGPMDELTLTENAQPALLAASLMTQKVLENEMGKEIQHIAHYAAGHSLGEYSALCASGVLSISDAALLVKIRGSAMQRAVPFGVGMMAAILGLDIEEVEKITKKSCDDQNLCVIANDNAPGQVVISGHAVAVEKAIAISKDKGAKRAIPLQVSAPFHSPLMGDAARVMEEAIDAMVFTDSKIPVLSNITADIYIDTKQMAELLVSQITNRVRWRETIENLTNNKNCKTVIEIGSGKVLSGLNKRISPALKSLTLNTVDDLDAIVEFLSIR